MLSLPAYPTAHRIVNIPPTEWLMATLDTGGEVEERLDLIQ